jgi:DNA polymerase-3 subunit epsilon
MTNKFLENLADRVLILDFQTSGARPPSAQIIEAAFASYRLLDEDDLKIETHLVGLAEERQLPKAVSRLTGIDEQDLDERGIEHEQLRALLEACCSEPFVACVIHYASFETPFIHDLMGQDSLLGARIICTFEVARRLFPDLPSRSLRALSGYLGFPICSDKRAQDHVRATAAIWKSLVTILQSEHGIYTLSELQKWLSVTPVPKAGKKLFRLDASVRLALPEKPGVYRFYNALGGLLYIGKARNLRSRINSYFRGRTTKGSRINELTAQISDIKYDLTYNEMHALMLESDLIKKHHPPYNRALMLGDRRCGFLTRTFEACECPDETPKYGPFPSLSYARMIENLMTLVASEMLDDGGELNLPSDIDSQMLLEGARLFKEQFPFDHEAPLTLENTSFRHVLAELWRQRIFAARQVAKEKLLSRLVLDWMEEEASVDEELEGDVVQLDEGWDAVKVARFIEHALGGFAHRCFKARWLARFINCYLIWREQSGMPWNCLEMKEGQPTFSLVSEFENGVPPCHDLNGLRRAGEPALIDIITYDRLMVLSATVRRYALTCEDVYLYYHKGSPLPKEEILRYIYPEADIFELLSK